MTHRNRKLPPRSTAEVGAAIILVVIVIVGFALTVTAALILAVVWIAQQRFGG